jgi:hypothetical protein
LLCARLVPTGDVAEESNARAAERLYDGSRLLV